MAATTTFRFEDYEQGKTNMKRILTLMIFSASLLGAQDRWVNFFIPAAGGAAYYDAETVHYRASDNQFVTAWVRVVEPDGGHTLLHVEVHATTRHMRSLWMVEYDANQRQIATGSSTTAWDDIVPESLADALFHRLYRVNAPAPPAVRTHL
jgi:hypothetical protein